MIEGVGAAILAGGSATRMGGRPKSFLEVGGRRVIDRQLEVLRATFRELVIVANDVAAYGGLGAPVVEDEVKGQGPLAGILAAIEAAEAERVVVLGCDLPFLDARALEVVASAEDELSQVVVPVVGGREEPLHARYARSAAAAIRARLAAGDFKVTHVYADLRVRRIEEDTLRAIDPGLKFLTNVNSPEELARLL